MMMPTFRFIAPDSGRGGWPSATPMVVVSVGSHAAISARVSEAHERAPYWSLMRRHAEV